MMSSALKNGVPFWEKYEFIIPLILFALFLAFTLPGISWGAPSVWHPDEIVVRSMKALHGEWKFSEINFDYPDLPQYIMFWLGKAILALGYSDTEILIASRVLSATLAGLTIVLAYMVTRRAGGSVHISGLAGLFLLCVSGLSHNGHFAHNDTYLIFFSTLTLLFLVNYNKTQKRGWLYASFITIGMAASSKYIGGSLVIVPLSLYLFSQRKNFGKDWFAIGETLFIGGVLTFLGYAAGTPKALFWMSYYFKRVYAALDWQVNYAKRPDSIRGVIGQYAVLEDGLGTALYLLFIAAVLWTCFQLFQAIRKNAFNRDSRASVLSIILLVIIALDLPMMISYNFQFRYFLALMPPLAILTAFFIEDMYKIAKQYKEGVYSALIIVSIAIIVLYSLTRLTSITLLFLNDARIPASEFMKTLPVGTSLEHTYYPPTIPAEHFDREHNYPIYFVKSEGEVLPTNKKYVFNIGEAGLDERMTDYFVIDSFTWEKFNNLYTCKIMQVECDFFKQLATGESAHYKLIADFSYQLPPFLPQLEISFVNPEIRIYERIP
jgi:4-amino-4-deoxy-L-arabinose transferase-like glycosyltransferase